MPHPRHLHQGRSSLRSAPEVHVLPVPLPRHESRGRSILLKFTLCSHGCSPPCGQSLHRERFSLRSAPDRHALPVPLPRHMSRGGLACGNSAIFVPRPVPDKVQQTYVKHTCSLPKLTKTFAHPQTRIEQCPSRGSFKT